MKLYKVAYVVRDVNTQIVIEDVQDELVPARSEEFAKQKVARGRMAAALSRWSMAQCEQYGIMLYKFKQMMRDGIIPVPNLVEVEVGKVELEQNDYNK